MKIYVLLPVHNRWRLTSQFLESLSEQLLDPGISVKTVVVDDGSTDQTASALSLKPELVVLPGSGKLWWGGCLDLGLRWIRPRLMDEDKVYVANNDTFLDPHHLQKLLAAGNVMGADMVGSVSIEIWPRGEHHPVSSAFSINRQSLDVVNIGIDSLDMVAVDAMATRGLLLSSRAAREIRFSPKFIPQHFADLAATSELIQKGFRTYVEESATSIQLDRAGSSVETKPAVLAFLSKKSSLYIPALVAFWWKQLGPRERSTLIWRIPLRALRQVLGGRYSWRPK